MQSWGRAGCSILVIKESYTEVNILIVLTVPCQEETSVFSGTKALSSWNNKGFYRWKTKNTSLSSIILCKMSMGCMFLHVVHDFFVSICWSHLHRIRKCVRVMLFLSQKGFCKGKEKNLCLFFHLKYCWFSWLKMQISIHRVRFIRYSLDAMYLHP